MGYYQYQNYIFSCHQKYDLIYSSNNYSYVQHIVTSTGRVGKKFIAFSVDISQKKIGFLKLLHPTSFYRDR